MTKNLYLVIVSTDLTLTTDRLTELFQSVEDPDNADPVMVEITDGTWSLGDSLGLPLSAMEEIRKSYQNNTKCKEAYLDTYAHHHLCPSWKKISKALRDCDLHEQACKVENTYIHRVHSADSK